MSNQDIKTLMESLDAIQNISEDDHYNRYGMDAISDLIGKARQYTGPQADEVTYLHGKIVDGVNRGGSVMKYVDQLRGILGLDEQTEGLVNEDQKIECSSCNGTGHFQGDHTEGECPDCDGDGWIWGDKVEETEQLDEAAFAKRHYTLIADVIKNDLGGDASVAQAFADALEGDNPRFNKQFFIDYATGATSKKRPPRV